MLLNIAVLSCLIGQFAYHTMTTIAAMMNLKKGLTGNNSTFMYQVCWRYAITASSFPSFVVDTIEQQLAFTFHVTNCLTKP